VRADLELAERAARAAGEVLLSYFGRAAEGLASKTSPTDPVSDADREAERTIRELLLGEHADDGILGEEGSHSRSASGRTWIVDPLDGTVNFLFGIPVWSVSVACEDSDGVLAGVVFDPLRGETWAATRDGSATLDGVPLESPPGRGQLSTALVATGFGYDAAVREVQSRAVARLLPRVRDVRRLGSAALDLAWTAAGRYDAYYEHGVKHWDVAAGALICARAGLAVHELPPAPPAERGLLVAPPALADELLALVTD
jgi:myo-inositol-1(or 4)-monophosphatase